METDLAKLTEQVNSVVSRVQRRNEQLESEVVALRAQLSAQAIQITPAEDSRKRKRSKVDDASDSQVVSLQAYEQLERKHQQMIQEYDKQISALTEKWKMARYTIKRWQKYCDEKLAKREERGNVEPASHLQPASSSTQDRSGTVVLASQNKPDPTNPGTDLTPRPGAVSGSTNAARQEVQPTTVQRHTSSQATDVASSPPPSSPPKPNYSSDSEPVVVSARLTEHGRRRQMRITPEPIKIKQERSTQSFPFDIPSGDNSTSSQRGSMTQERSYLDSPPEMDLDEKDFPQGTQTRYPTPTSAPGPNYAVPSHVDKHPPFSGGQGDANGMETSRDEDSQQGVLKPLSINIPTPHPFSALKEKPRSSRPPSGIQNKIKLLAEAGDEGPSQLPRSEKGANKTSGISDEARQRLELMLDQSQQPKAPTLTKRAQVGPRKDKNEMTTLVPRAIPEAASNRPVNSITPMANTAHRQSSGLRRTDLKRSFRNPAMKAPSENIIKAPLRSLPLQALKLNDFKISPRFQGTDYAFADTVRGKEQRRCLRGCTRPDCCGEGLRRTFELMGGGTLTSKKTDREAMEAYLGTDWRGVMSKYDNDKRKITLNEAHFRAWANDMGKHRTAFEKPLEPPGYWETEMPSTQQAKEYRDLADEQEKEKIESRWNEAMSGNGRWIFQDES